MLSKEVSSTISKVFGMPWAGIEPRSPGLLYNNTLLLFALSEGTSLGVILNRLGWMIITTKFDSHQVLHNKLIFVKKTICLGTNLTFSSLTYHPKYIRLMKNLWQRRLLCLFFNEIVLRQFIMWSIIVRFLIIWNAKDQMFFNCTSSSGVVLTLAHHKIFFSIPYADIFLYLNIFNNWKY